MKKNFAALLTTVNAPYLEQVDGAILAACLSDINLAKSKPGHMSSFFGEVPAQSQKMFALHNGVPLIKLIAIAAEFADYSGEEYPLYI